MRATHGRGAAVIIVLAAGLTACGVRSGSTQESSGTELQGLAQTSWQRAGYASVRQGGTLTLALNKLPATLNNLQVQGQSSDTMEMQTPVLRSAVVYAQDGSWSTDPTYARSIRLVGTDPQRVEVNLNPKAVWSDGTPITVKDMASNWKAMNGANKAYQIASPAGYQDIGSIERGANDFSYTVTFKRKNGDWPSYVYPVLPAVVTDSAKAFNADYRSRPFPSNGPFVISNIDTTAQVVTQIPNPRWWGRKPRLDRIVFRVIAPASRGQSFVNGELDVMDTGANVGLLQQAQRRADAVVQRSQGLSWTHVTLNGSRPPLNDVNVRKAVAQAIDRQGIATVLHNGLGIQSTTQGSILFVPGQKGYQDVQGQTLPYSVPAAEQHLQRAGYVKGPDGVFVKDNKPLTMSFTFPADNPGSSQRAQLIQGSLAKAGIKVSLNPVPGNAFFPSYVAPRNFQMTSFTWEGNPWPISQAEPLYYPADSEQNFSGVSDPSLGAKWAAANTELDPAKRDALAQDIVRTVVGYVPLIPLAPTPTVMAVKKGLVNYGARQFETVDWTQVGFTN